MSTLNRDSKLESDESIFVIGVKPKNFRISVFPGSVDDGVFTQSLLRSAVVFAFPEDGYVVAKAHAGDILALTMATPYEEGEFLRRPYGACDGRSAPTFNVPSGKIIYLTDVSYRYSGTGIATSYAKDFESARRYIDQSYGQFKGKLEEWPSELLSVNKSCTTQVTVVVPVAR
jgi:hypothetical protein